MKHTPGPWIASFTNRKDPFARAYIKHPSGFVCGIYGGRTEEVCGADEADANARLIAAAPELLAALQAINAALTQPVQFSGSDATGTCNILRGDCQVAASIARAAIAKATGESDR